MLDIAINVSVQEFVFLLKTVSMFLISISVFSGAVLFVVKKKRLKMEFEEINEEPEIILENGGI